MKRKHRIWLWIITPFILLFLTAAAFHLIPRWQLHAYKQQLIAQGFPLTLKELQPQHSSPQARTAATQFNTAADQLGSLNQILPNTPSAMQMKAPGLALPGWLTPHLGYLHSQTMDANTTRLLMQRYGLAPANLSNATPSSPATPLTNPVYTAWSDLTTELEKVHPALTTITALSHEPSFDWNINYSDGFSVMLPHLASLKNASQWLAAASLHELHHQNHEAALQYLLTQLRLVKNQDDNSFLMGQLLHIATAAIAWDNTWAALQSPHWTDPQLQELQTAWEQIDITTPTLNTLQLERATILLEYQKCRRSVTYTKELFDAFLNTSSDDTGNFVESAIHWLREKVASNDTFPLRYHWWIWFQSYDDELTYLQDSQTFIEALQLRNTLAHQYPNPANHLPPHSPWMPPSTEDQVPDQYLFAANITTPLTYAIERAIRIQTQQQLALTAIAIQRYQLTHTNPPPALTNLIPAYLQSTPLDWTAGHPLHYQTTPSNTFTLYACGYNGLDDGGDPSPTQPQHSRFFSFYNAKDFVWPQPALPPLLTPNNFTQGFRLPHKNSDPETFRLQTSPNHPPLWITATTTTPPQSLFPPDTSPDQSLGLIHIAAGYPPNPTQILPAFSPHKDRNYAIKANLIAIDLNHDSLPDLALLHPSPLESPYSHTWLYNPTNQSFTPSPPPATLLQ